MNLLRSASSLAFSLALASAASASTLFVDADLTTGANDGSSWQDAYQGIDGLQAALAAAQSGDEIFVAGGLYRTSGSGDRQISFEMANGVEIYGGFAGGESSASERPPLGVAPSVLTADQNGDDGSSLFNDNSHHVVRAAAVDATAVLDGFTITGGNANGPMAGNSDRGAGIICTLNSRATVRNCFFVDNQCTFGGGAGYVLGSSPSFESCAFVDNLGGAFGGAFDIANSGTPNFDRCYFEGNRAARGGALEIFNTTGAVVANSTFWRNTATGGSGGGGLWIGFGGATTVRNCTIVANVAQAQNAGGLRDQGSDVTVQSCILWDNEGPGGAQGPNNQLIANDSVTFTLVEGGFAGFGNLSSDPQFTDLANGDFSLQLSSPCIDAGTNFDIQNGDLDIGFNPRLRDEPTVVDTGFGLPPIADIGAFEYTGQVPVAYCTSKLSSAGCNTRIATNFPAGAPTSGAADYEVRAFGAQGAKNGLVFGGLMPNNAPFNGGTLCVQPPLKRGPIVNSQGSSATSCDGFFATIVNDGALITSGAGLDGGAGTTVYYQYWYRDPANGAGSLGTALSDAIELLFL